MSVKIFQNPKLWIVTLFGFCVFSTQAQTKWDLASAYPVSNFHTENLQQLAADVEKATGGSLKIVVHPNGSLFPANGIRSEEHTSELQSH